MQQLTREEAGRVTSILQDTTARLKLLARLPYTSREFANLVETAGELGQNEIAEELAHVAQVEQDYKEAMKHARQIGAEQSTVDDSALRASYKRLAHMLRVDRRAAEVLPTVATVPRSAGAKHTNQEPVEEATSPSSGHSGHMSGLIERMAPLIEVSSRKLVTTRAAARDEQVETQNKQTRIDNAEREVALLQDELKRQRAARAKQITELEDVLTAVRNELVSVAKSAESELKQLQATGHVKTTDIDSGHGSREAALKAQLEKLNVEYKTASEAHIEAEANIRKRKVRARAEVEAAIGKIRQAGVHGTHVMHARMCMRSIILGPPSAAEHDAAVAVANAAVAEMRSCIETEASPLRDLKAYYARIDAELERIRIEERKERRRVAMDEEAPRLRMKWVHADSRGVVHAPVAHTHSRLTPCL